MYCLGHAHPEVNDAIKRQLDAVAHAYRYNFASDPMEQLTREALRAIDRLDQLFREVRRDCAGEEGVGE